MPQHPLSVGAISSSAGDEGRGGRSVCTVSTRVCAAPAAEPVGSSATTADTSSGTAAGSGGGGLSGSAGRGSSTPLPVSATILSRRSKMWVTSFARFPVTPSAQRAQPRVSTCCAHTPELPATKGRT